MQMPILTYPNFSQFLQLHQQQQQLQQQYTSRPERAGSETSADTSPSPSPPLSPAQSPPLTAPDKNHPGKSFTIDAILGLRESNDRDSLAFHSAFHPRLHVSDLSRLTGVLGSNREPSNFSTSSRHTDKSLADGSKKCSSGKSKRVRTIFTPEQLERLESEFERQQYMVGPERLYLAHTLQLTEAQVKVWFQNRRIKWRKQHLELQQQRLAVIKQRQRLEVDDSGDSDDDSSAGGKFTTADGSSGGGGGLAGATFPSFVAEPSNSETPYPMTYTVESTRSSREQSSDHQ